MKYTRALILLFALSLPTVLVPSTGAAQDGWERQRKEVEKQEKEYRKAAEKAHKEREKRLEKADKEREKRLEEEWKRREKYEKEARKRHESRERDDDYRDYDDRDDRRGERRDDYGSFDRAHADFHREHDWVCRERAARRPLDPVWQIRVRSECKAEHDRWHQQAGIGHDGRRNSRY